MCVYTPCAPTHAWGVRPVAGEILSKIHKGTWVGWKRPGDQAAAGGPLFVNDAFYNFLCPERPNEQQRQKQHSRVIATVATVGTAAAAAAAAAGFAHAVAHTCNCIIFLPPTPGTLVNMEHACMASLPTIGYEGSRRVAIEHTTYFYGACMQMQDDLYGQNPRILYFRMGCAKGP
eukprot:366375-Chlamydomonas_euryale.AAC.7